MRGGAPWRMGHCWPMTLTMESGQTARKRLLCTELETKRGSAQSMPFSTCNIIGQQWLMHQRCTTAHENSTFLLFQGKVVKSILGRGGTPLFERSVLRLVRMRG